MVPQESMSTIQNHQSSTYPHKILLSYICKTKHIMLSNWKGTKNDLIRVNIPQRKNKSRLPVRKLIFILLKIPKKKFQVLRILICFFCSFQKFLLKQNIFTTVFYKGLLFRIVSILTVVSGTLLLLLTTVTLLRFFRVDVFFDTDAFMMQLSCS